MEISTSSQILINTLFKPVNGKMTFPESDNIEYKSIFNWSERKSAIKYIKTMAAFFNRSGGHLIFGVDNKTLEISDVSNFKNIDNAEISGLLNTYFTGAGEIAYSCHTIEEGSITLGVIYVYPRRRLPAICLKEYTDGKERILRPSDVYFRYNSMTEVIRPADLQILMERLSENAITHQAEQFRKKDFQPKFESRGGQFSTDHKHIEFENTGEQATILDIIELPKNDCRFNYPKESFGKNSRMRIQLIPNHPVSDNTKVQYEFNLLYKDRDGRKYLQRVENLPYGGAAKIDEPIDF